MLLYLKQENSIVDKQQGDEIRRVCILAILIFALVFFGCTSSQQAPTNQMPTITQNGSIPQAQKTASETCDKLEDSTDRLKCKIEVARATKNVTFCDRIEDLYYQDLCYWKLANATQNVTLCEKNIDPLTEDSLDRM